MESKIKFSDIKQSFRLFFKFNKYILRYWRFELAILILGNFSIILSLVNPYIGKNILDKGILAKNIRGFIIFSLLGIGIYIINVGISNFHKYLKIIAIRKIKFALAKDVLVQMKRYSLSYFQGKSTGSFMFKLSHDLADAINIINDTLPNIITTIFKLILITTIIIFINWKILILIILFQLLILRQIKLFIKKIQELIILSLKSYEDTFRRLIEVFSHIYLVKAFGTIAKELRRYFHDLTKIIRLEEIKIRLEILIDVLHTTSDKLFFGVVGLYGAILVIRGQMTFGSLSAIMVYITQGVGAYSALLHSGEQLLLSSLILERVSELLDQEIDIKEKNNAYDIVFLKGKIEFKNVSFGYKKDKLILDNISFTIPPYSHIALIGTSGCGKTTIFNLILRLYDVNKGTILLEDCNVKDLKFKALYRQIGIALQDPLLWNDTILNNIRYGEEDANLNEIIEAAELAGAHQFIDMLPNKYDTYIGEDACLLSQGQKQRIAIVRAVIKRPKILMLDEAMSSLDSETEDKIIDNIKKEFRDSTVIIVSHRLSAVKKMDLIYFLETPHKMEIGSQEELLERNPKYRELFASQIEQDAYYKSRS